MKNLFKCLIDNIRFLVLYSIFIEDINIISLCVWVRIEKEVIDLKFFYTEGKGIDGEWRIICEENIGS